MSSERRELVLKWGATLLIPLGVGWCAHSLECSPTALRFYVITSLALCLWIGNLYPESLVAIVIPVLYILAGVGSPGQILSVWASPIGWLVLGGLIIGDMMSQTGIGKRLALLALSRCGGSLERLLWGVVLAGFVISPFVPTGMGKAAILGIILVDICRTLDIKAQSREASCLFLAAIVAVTGPKFIFFTAGIDAAMLVELMRKGGASVTWFSFVRDNALPGLLYTALCVLLLKFLFRPRGPQGIAALVQKERRKLGPWQPQERRALALLLCLAVGLATDSLHGVDSGWLMMLAAAACFLPGLRLMDQSRLATLPLQVVFFVVGSLSIGIAARAAGVDTAVAQALTPLLEKGGGIVSFAAVYLSGTGLLMALTSLPAISTFTMPLTEAGLRLGGAEQALPYAFLYGVDQYLMPYSFGPALYIFALGYIHIREYIMYQLAKCVLGLAFVTLVAYPIWKMMLN